MNSEDIKCLAYYLPQFHPIPENDLWWGTGFTEWTNVKKAQPLFKGHQQPLLPGALGYYDLLEQPEIQEQQAQLAQEYGVDGLIYYQYWFGNGKMLLEKPAEAMLKNKKVALPFCFCWANETWKGIWHGLDNPDTLIEQTYPGVDDFTAYFNYLLPFFNDERYIRINNQPVFIVYDSIALPAEFIVVFRKLALEHGLPGIYFMASNRGSNTYDYKVKGFDAKISGDYNVLLDTELQKARQLSTLQKIALKLGLLAAKPAIINYKKMFDKLRYTAANLPTFPMVVPNWDNTPRSKYKGFLFENSSPQLFKNELDKAKRFLETQADANKIIVVKSWNEWAEGNIIEPDATNGDAYLSQIKALKEQR